MRERHARFHFKSADQLRAEAKSMGLALPMDSDLSSLRTPVAVAGRSAPNRFCALPMEGFDSGPDGAPGPLTFRRYARYARGGFGLIWFEATAVRNEARSNPGQLCLHAGNVAAFAELARSVRQAARQALGREPVLVVQLTHSGRYCKPAGLPEPLIAHRSPILDPLHSLPPEYPVVTDEYLDRLQDTYVAAARLAAAAGFDGVDVKSCHRYLVSELLASHTRTGRYGGDIENRSRFLVEVCARIRGETRDVFVTTRMNAYDAIAYPYGFGVDRTDYQVPDLAEPIEVVRRLRDLGIPLINITIGNPYFYPHHGRPYDFPVQGGTAPGEHPLVGIERFLAIARRIQQAFPALPVVGSGYSWLRHLLPQVAAGVLKGGGATFIGLGREAFAYPDAVRDILEQGRMDPARCCVACSACTQIMRDGAMTGCVVRDSEIYGPQYRLGRRFALDRLQAEARRCRECEVPTCRAGCPARVEIPEFLRAFADGDVGRAYAVLRRNNALPEMCGYICPSEVQCEGGCVEKVFCERPVPIQDIQLLVCKLARRRGLTGVRLPAAESGRRVAIAGGGPAGLACAIALIERGHRVVLLERGDRLGGTPQTIIPGDRYGEAQTEVDAILAPALAAGRAEVRCGQELGRTVTLAALRSSHDAVLLAFGLGRSTTLGRADGVWDALAFLQAAKSGALGSVPGRVAVLGGGNTAMDAAATARRMGARDVFLLYRRSFDEMPAWPRERQRFLDAGGHCLILTQPLGYATTADGRLSGVRIARTELGEPDASGRRRPRVAPGTESVLAVDLAVEALGQQVSDEARAAIAGVELTEDGLVRTKAPGSAATGLAGVFAAGDLVNGGTTAVQGIAEGMAAAEEIHAVLSGGGAQPR